MAQTKAERAVEIVRENKGKTRKEVISIIMTELKMSDAGASTYYYNASKTIKTEDALATIKTEDGDKTETTSDDSAASKPAKKGKTKSEEKVPATAERRQWPNFNTEGHKEIEAFLESIDVSTIPTFLRK
ncbi:hypothetical protein EVB91_286 [Rhizobium phage RHph_I1_18]|nr:hypothetical protein EVB91_286 [Rhizobium phage RHph_I1_18]